MDLLPAFVGGQQSLANGQPSVIAVEKWKDARYRRPGRKAAKQWSTSISVPKIMAVLASNNATRDLGPGPARILFAPNKQSLSLLLALWAGFALEIKYVAKATY